MALLFMDSFDHYASADFLLKWTGYESAGATNITAGVGRHGSAALVISSGGWWVYKSFPAAATVIVGLAFKNAALGGNPVQLLDGGAGQVLIRLNTDGSLSAYRMLSGFDSPDAVLGTSAAGVITAGTFYYVEAKVTIHSTAGAVTLRVNGAVVLALTGVNTRGAGASTNQVTRLYLSTYGSGGSTLTIDDLYLLDDTGSTPLNNLLGDVRVDARFPSGAGSNTGWTPSAGSNYTCVDESAPNGDTDYVSATSSGLKDTYAVQDAPVAGGTIYGVQVLWHLKKTDASTCSVAPVVRHSGTDNVGTAQNPTTSYLYQSQLYPTNPGTSVAWVEADFNAAEFGVTRVS